MFWVLHIFTESHAYVYVNNELLYYRYCDFGQNGSGMIWDMYQMANKVGQMPRQACTEHM